MTKRVYIQKFKLSLLSSLTVLTAVSAHALQPLSDEKLGNTTGEGIAILPQDAYMIFQGDRATASDLTNRLSDTGYIHLVPVGPLSQAALDTNKDRVVDSRDHSVGKADVFLYGLALSKSDDDYKTRIVTNLNDAKIGSWGTPTNPWLLRGVTENHVPNFDLKTECRPVDKSCTVPYITLEAPLMDVVKPTTVAAGADAYKLKLAMWADAFVLDPLRVEGDGRLYQMGEKSGTSDPNRENRLRLQAIWNNFSINGSNIKVFQTLGGATTAGGMSPFYNNTLGLAGAIRLNSGDSEKLSTNSVTKNILRLSTKESTRSNLLDTPAIHRTNAPVFDGTEGIFIHNLNANLILGSLYQPLIVGSDGKNFSIELTRIPNKPEVYRKIYIDYDNPKSTAYLGSTCNIYQCGTNGIGDKYQGNNATHSSITIGSTVYNDKNNTLSAYKGADAVGISFGPTNQTIPNQTPNINSNINNFGSAVIDGVLIQHMKITTKGL